MSALGAHIRTFHHNASWRKVITPGESANGVEEDLSIAEKFRRAYAQRAERVAVKQQRNRAQALESYLEGFKM